MGRRATLNDGLSLPLSRVCSCCKQMQHLSYPEAFGSCIMYKQRPSTALSEEMPVSAGALALSCILWLYAINQAP